jgi:hypothetical protein
VGQWCSQDSIVGGSIWRTRGSASFHGVWDGAPAVKRNFCDFNSNFMTQNLMVTIMCCVNQSCSCRLAGVISHIINYSFRTGTVPELWLTAIVAQVPKVSVPKSIVDFRPISVTPVLSRIN